MENHMTGTAEGSDGAPAAQDMRAGPSFAFPIDAAVLTPHARPMLAIDQVLSGAAGEGRVALKAQAGAWYMHADGRWDEVSGIELISQAAAAISGLTPPAGASRPPVCFLAEVRHYQVHGEARVGDELVIDIRKAGEFGGFFVTEGEMRCGDTVIATAELTFWRDDRGTTGGTSEGQSHA